MVHSEMMEQIQKAVQYLKKQVPSIPKVAIVLGSGLGDIADQLEDSRGYSYAQIPGFPTSTAPGHKGELVFGRLGKQPVMLMNGRTHFYEGYDMKTITFPIRVMQLLGVETLMLTNAAGGLNPDFEVGTPMLIQDHINMMGDNPLTGMNLDELGPRFPDMSHAYDPGLQELAREAAHQLGIPIQSGVYVGVAGPNFETPAELRMLRHMGADAVGMSTIPEVIVAVHGGLKVLAFSAITDRAVADDLQPLTAEEVLEIAEKTGKKIGQILIAVCEQL
ncbi:MAG TPA: purine-nucleoside phosphorylase [Thermotogota bacterium]|nr:purine-nucleoside phosphorylase [Thermotogota bacterium]HRW91937.1 purine-nucleoside phosphorylase [Thermotogota bacterium]